MNITINRKDLFWSYLSQILNYGSGLLLLPIILHSLTTSHLAIWYILLATNAATNLLDFGFQPNLMRNVSYVMGGAQNLISNGIGKLEKGNKINWQLFWSLVHTAKKIYRIISIIVFALLLTFGTYYIYSITTTMVDQDYILISWFLYISILVINFYFSYYNPLLLGRGMIREYNLTIIFTKSTNLVLSIIALYIGLGLQGIVLSLFISTIVDRYFARKFFFKGLNKDLLKSKECQGLFSVLWSNSWKLGVGSLGAFLILRANIFLVSKYLPLSEAASYGLTLQLMTTVVSFGNIFFTAHLPKINIYRLEQNNQEIKRVVAYSLVVSWIIFITSSICLILFGNTLLLFIHSKTTLISKYNLAFLSLILFLEMNHSLFASLITTKNIVPFVKPAIFSGIFIVFFSFLSLKFFSSGLFGILISQFIVQLSYNNWKWPTVGLRDLKTNIFELIITPIKTLLFNR